MKSAKCPNCGANISVDESKDAGICEFCNTPFVTDKALSIVNNTSNNAQTIINNYYNVPNPTNSANNPVAQDTETPRPKVNIWIAIFLFYLYIFPGIIYICSVKKQQEEWDEKHNIKK